MASVSIRELTSIEDAIGGPAGFRLAAPWRESAACRRADPDLFVPLGSAGPATATEVARAKAICAGCPVRRPCLAYALITGQEYGIWGGCDEQDRRQLHWQWRETRTGVR